MTRTMKDSGVEWIGQIPERWNVIRNKYLMTKVKIIKQIYEQEPILSLTMNGVIKRDLDNPTGKMPTTFDGYQILKPNNLLMCLFDIDVTPRCIGIINEYGLSSPAYSQFVLNNKLNTRYAYYYYLNLDFTKELLHLAKNLRHSLTEEQLGYVPVPLPPLPEQQAIADYLDDKCAQINNITATINEQIEVLKQYKKSVITEAVTKGLDPNAPMKDSGVEWIGRIPEHWEVIKGKYRLKLLNRPVKENDEVITCFRDGEVTLRSKRREDGFTISLQETGYQGINPGDLVVHGMDGFAGAIGISDSRGKATPVLNVLDTKENKKFFMYYLRTLAFTEVFIALSTGIRVRSCDTNWNKLRQLVYLIPPLSEQQAIADYLGDKCTKIDAVIADKQAQLETLAAYKKSLIYEYVTGKKSVPGFEEA